MHIILLLILIILIIVFFPIIISFLIGLASILISIVIDIWWILVVFVVGLIIYLMATKFSQKFKESNYPHKKVLTITSSVLLSVFLIYGILIKTCTILIYPIKCSYNQLSDDRAKYGSRIENKLFADRDSSFCPFDSISLGSEKADWIKKYGYEENILNLREEFCTPKKLKRNIHIGKEEFTAICTPIFYDDILYSLSYLITSPFDESNIDKIILNEYGKKRLEIKRKDKYNSWIKYVWQKGDTKIEYINGTITIAKSRTKPAVYKVE